MLQRDYLTQMITQFIQAILRSHKTAKVDPQAAADSLENAIAAATDIDGAMLLSLGPESMASVMELSGVDEHVAGYISHSLALEAEYLRDAGQTELADLRAAQAQALEQTFGINPEEVAAELAQSEE